MARIRSPLTRSCRAPVEALACLLAILLGPVQALPGALALGAVLEGSHTVRVGSDGDGLRLVLSHERGTTGRIDYNPRHQPCDPSHLHGPAAGILCLLAADDQAHPDHSAYFAAGSVVESSAPSPHATAVGRDFGHVHPASVAVAGELSGTIDSVAFPGHEPPGQHRSVLRPTTVLRI